MVKQLVIKDELFSKRFSQPLQYYEEEFQKENSMYRDAFHAYIKMH